MELAIRKKTYIQETTNSGYEKLIYYCPKLGWKRVRGRSNNLVKKPGFSWPS
jgi:hypothetical protein